MRFGEKKPLLIVGIVLLIIGARSIVSLRVAGNVFQAVYGKNIPLIQMDDVKGTVTKVEKITAPRNSDLNVTSGYDVFVTYEYDGKTYEDIVIEHYELKFIEGDTVELKVLKNMPEIVRINYPMAYYNYYTVLAYVIVGVGLILIIAFIYLNYRES